LKYKPDDNARDQAIAVARTADPAADHAAEAIVIYDLARPGTFELADGIAGERRAARYEVRPPAAPPAAVAAAAPAAPPAVVASRNPITTDGGSRR
jgi:hypothetical protein